MTTAPDPVPDPPEVVAPTRPPTPPDAPADREPAEGGSVDGESVDDRPRLVHFRIGDRDLLAPVGSVSEVLVPPPCTRLPGAAEAIVGVTSVRGRVVAVIDPRATLGAAGPPGDEPRLLVVPMPSGSAALLVDAVEAVVAADHLELLDDAAPPMLGRAVVEGREHPVVDPAATIGLAVDGTGAADTDEIAGGAATVGSSP